MERGIGIFSFFSGAGFLDLGFETTDGYHVDFVSEIHKPFLDAYKYSRQKLNISEPIFGYHLEDINNILRSHQLKELYAEAKKIRDLVGFIGGPPCPDFSVAGKNKGEKGDNGRLSLAYIELICTVFPDFFLFENVKGLYKTEKHRAFFEQLKEKLRLAGYSLTERLVNSIEFGTPQDRDRIILLGFKRSAIEYIGQQPEEFSLEKRFDWHSHIKYSKQHIFSLNWPLPEAVAEMRETPDGIPHELTVQHWFNKNDVENHPNASHFFTPKSLRFPSIYEGDVSRKSYKRLHRWRYSPTVAYGNNEVHLHPYYNRRISAAEAMSLQSLPKSFELPPNMTLSNMFKTIGNGVPFLLSKGLAHTILDFIMSNKKTNGEAYSGKSSNLHQPAASKTAV